MPSPVSPWHQRLPEEVQDRLERAEALAREALVETHAHLADDLVSILAPRMAFDEAVERYLEIMKLDPAEAEMVGTRALARLSDSEVREDAEREGRRGWGFDWRYVTPLGALRYIQRQRKRSAEEQLWLELAAARGEEKLIAEHVQHAHRFIEILSDQADPTRAVELYVDRLDLPDDRARAVYQRVLADLAEELLPRLDEEGEEASPARETPA
ncbi:MAG TPA: hypothetical protein VFX98_02955 [Longimicrobiaceae bacterium]|nr:hypothetical protein [Longimicrobiaceae bacterium]